MSTETTETIGARIRWCRTNKGLSQHELAKRCGIRCQYISNYETGRVDIPSVPVLASMSRELGVSMDYLVFGGSRTHLAV